MASPSLRRAGLVFISLVLAAAVWLPALHLFFPADVENTFASDGIPPRARALARQHLALWSDPALREVEIRNMRATNAEWDFMARSFFVWALCNMAARDPDEATACLSVVDLILDETRRLEAEKGHLHFLMDYARGTDFMLQPNRSLFVDGEIALMMGLRRMVEEKEEYREPMGERIRTMVERMEQSPVLSAESYPNECWTFCNAVALAATVVWDRLEGDDHSGFRGRWIETAKQKLIHPDTGLLVSMYGTDGTFFDGPEGSTIWMALHCLDIVDPGFARDQYAIARKELRRAMLGFGYAREWPESWQGAKDVDSGPVIPWFEASAGSSGLAFLGAATFDDREYLGQLLRSLQFAGFPLERNGRLRFCASNQVGDAVILYAAMQGPLWRRLKEGGP